MRTRGILIGAAIVAALSVVFYSGANRRVEIAFLIAFVVLFTVVLRLARPIKAYSGIATVGAVNNKTVMCWVFAITSLQYLLDPRVSMLYAARRHLILLTVRNFATFVLYVGLSVACGLAWWSIWKKKPSARAWGITASVGYILLFLRPIIFFPASAWWRHWSELLIGTVGLLTFAPSQENEQAPEEQEAPYEPEAEADGGTWLKLT
jgi:hypothetical protein